MKLQKLFRCVVIALASMSLTESAIAASPERPYSGSCSTVVTPLTPPGVFPQELHIDYDCTLAHLGHATAVATQVVTPINQSGVLVTATITNSTTYTAANGDTLHASFTGTALLNVETGQVRFIGTEKFDGGSGRFDDASGSADLDGSGSFFTNIAFFTAKGRIAY